VNKKDWLTSVPERKKERKTGYRLESM